MKFITDREAVGYKSTSIGGKAANLYTLKAAGLRVPRWIVIPQEELMELLPVEARVLNNNEIQSLVDKVELPSTFTENIVKYFNNNLYYSVRSSATDEDGNEFSFAGQFESYLFVKKDQLESAVRKVWKSAFSDRVNVYRKSNNLKKSFGIAVIVQEMIPSDISGVAFGIHPGTGDRESQLICAVYGLGEGLVSGDLDADNYIVKGKSIQTQLADKPNKIVFDISKKEGTKKEAVDTDKRYLSSLSDEQVLEISELLLICEKLFGKAQDIEFAIFENKIYLLQARPITNLSKLSNKRENYILWDNSNIIESYPGVTTPLTFSFISKSYETAYKLFCNYMGVEERVIHDNEHVFANTLGFINGRVYYNLKSWYFMLAMLPGYSINARYMEKMMGVKEQFDIPENFRLSKVKAWWQIFKMAVKMFIRFQQLPQKRKAFMVLLEKIISDYKSMQLGEKSAFELMQLYRSFEKTLLNEWKAPLINDFFAMIWFGRIEKMCRKYKISKNPNIHNDLLCGSKDIISTQPIHRSISLAANIHSSPDLKALFLDHDEGEIRKLLSEDKRPSFISLKKEIDRYISDFGERCIGELKLETISYTQDPKKFIKLLKSYVETEITGKTRSGCTEQQTREKAEQELEHTLRYKPLSKIKLKRTLQKARDLVSARENLRYERTRAFGIVRELFSHIGKCFYSEKILSDARDIFYLTKDEIFAYIEGRSVVQDLSTLVNVRKKEFEGYQNQQAPSERFATYGMVYSNNDFYSTDKSDKISSDLKGIGCSPGRVRGKVNVVMNPHEISSLHGDILVTSSTDPGWVTLFPSAAAIIVERGSLLSHSAIVSREMGIPCIVSVSGLLRSLKTGDEIEMDGGSGEIKIINTKS